jgi:uracil-DNA glycosylase
MADKTVDKKEDKKEDKKSKSKELIEKLKPQVDLITAHSPEYIDLLFKKNASGFLKSVNNIMAVTPIARWNPPVSKMLSCYTLTEFAKLRVVIVGQDAYPHEGDACGVAFGTPTDRKPPLSLRVIFNCLVNNGLLSEMPVCGDLTPIAKQGVLLTNIGITTEVGKIAAHLSSWEVYSERVLIDLSEMKKLVFVLWGSRAQQLIGRLSSQSVVLKFAHPSYSTRIKADNKMHFSKCPNFLELNDILDPPINWEVLVNKDIPKPAAKSRKKATMEKTAKTIEDKSMDKPNAAIKLVREELTDLKLIADENSDNDDLFDNPPWEDTVKIETNTAKNDTSNNARDACPRQATNSDTLNSGDSVLVASNKNNHRDDSHTMVNSQQLNLDISPEATTLIISTDGACIGNGRTKSSAGYAFVFCFASPNWTDKDPVTCYEFSSRLKATAIPGEKYTVSNNRAELTPIKEGLELAIDLIKRGKIPPQIKYINVLTDSEYSINCCTDWALNWKGSKDEAEKKNKDLIYPIIDLNKELVALSYSVKFEHVRSHKKAPEKGTHEYAMWYLNDRCDKLAGKEIGGETKKVTTRKAKPVKKVDRC